MKLSIFYDHLRNAAAQRGLPMDAVLAEAKQAGIDWIEIGLDELRQDGDAILAGLRRAGLGMSCVYANYDWCGTEALDTGREHVDTALACGARSILVIPGQLPIDEAEQLRTCCGSYARFAAVLDANEKVQRMLRGVQDTVAYADGRLAVTMEDYDQRTAVFADMYGLRYFLENTPGLGLAFDCGNFAYMDEDAVAAWKMIGQYTVHVHCKDRGEEEAVLAQGLHYNRGLAPVAAGSGYLPIGRIVTGLLAKGYDGIFAIEHFGHPDQLQAMRDSAEFLQSLHA